MNFAAIWSGLKAAPELISLILTVIKAVQSVELSVHKKEIANDMSAAIKKATATPGATDDISAVFARIHAINNP